jgi:hypothetical protein
MPVYCSRIGRRVRLAENANGIAGLKIPPGESDISAEREMSDREHVDELQDPDGAALHLTAPKGWCTN